MEPNENQPRINALRQLLAITLPQVVAAYEGQTDSATYISLHQQRVAWERELRELTGETAAPQGTPLLTRVETENEILGEQTVAITISDMQKESDLSALGQQTVENAIKLMELEALILNGGSENGLLG